MFKVFHVLPPLYPHVSVFCDYSNESPQTGWLKTADTSSLAILEAEGEVSSMESKSRYQQGDAPSGDQGRTRSLPPPASVAASL